MAKESKGIVSFLLRAGVASSFLYAAISTTLDPQAWAGYMPLWIRSIAPANILLMAFSAYEIVLALWLMSGKKLFYPAAMAAATLFAIIITNTAVLDVVFRDIPIMLAAIALAIIGKEEK